MTGKVVLVTGGTSGIGRETAIGLVRLGARVFLTGRDEGRCAETVQWIESGCDGAKVEGLMGDLSVQSEVRRLVMELRSKTDRLDVLVNNAGGWFGERRLTVDGFERTWALNHLAYVLMTMELLDMLRASGAGRVVNVASHLHAYGKMDFEDLNGERGYGSTKAYNQSKLANVLFTMALARQMEGRGLTVNALHPGAVATGMGRDMTPVMRLANGVMRWFYLSAEKGARTSIYLASSPEVAGVTGKYFVRCKEVRPARVCEDVALQERLWKVSREQVGW
ncbi:SDR family oxidoreductase [Phragmitibacter flavus]|uniref:SDR family oxidoreductase n=2 Tax=Phragmitibacter flavus TaxID=2576071 RepID=A0A5R8KBK7_9BACT|nr:SDR family oxidoreductase [Phragmitibacter flavus]